MDRIDAMRLFVRAAEIGTFSGSARDAGVGQPTVSKAIASLEERLGAPLFYRNSRRLALTEAGHTYLERCRRVIQEADESDAAVTSLSGSATGLIRLGAPATFGRLHIVPVLSEILRDLPGLNIELYMSDRRSNLIEQGADVAIRVGQIVDPAYAVTPLAKTRLVVVGSRRYLDRHGRPERVADLSGHNCLTYSASERPDEWVFVDGGRIEVPVRGNIRADNMDALRTAVLQDMGLAMMTAATVHEELLDGTVELVLSDYTPFWLDVAAVYLASDYPSRKRTHLIDLLRTRLAARLASMD